MGYDWLSNVPFIGDSLINLISGLGTNKDPRTAARYVLKLLRRDELEAAYRSDWLARALIDAPAEDGTREWRAWQASQPQIEAIEELERKFDIPRKVKVALIRARLYGGAGIVLGVADGKQPEEPLDVEKVKKDGLSFCVVLSCWEMGSASLIYDVSSEWFMRPEYYAVSSPMYGWMQQNGKGPQPNPNDPLTSLAELRRKVEGQVNIHPSRVIPFVGNQLPDQRLMGNSGTGDWGDSILQTVDEALRDWAMTVGSVAAMVNDAKVDVIKVKGLSERSADERYRKKLLARFGLANLAKSINNSLLLDIDEEWERIQTSFASVPQLISEMRTVACGAAGIPVSRAMGQAPGHGLGHSTTGAGGQQDMKNYYDRQASLQNTEYRPRLSPFDEVIIRAALGSRDPAIHYVWNPLYKQDPKEKADTDLVKAQTFQIDVSLGIINEDTMREARINQIIEDAVYPGFEDAVEANNDGKPEEPDVPPGHMLDPKTGLPVPAGPLRLAPVPPPGAKPGGPPPGLPAPKKSQSAKDAWEAWDQGFVDYRPDQSRDPRGRFAEEGGAVGAAFSVGGAAVQPHKYGLVPGDLEKFQGLKDEWSQVNNALISEIDTPESPAAKAGLARLEAISQEIHGLHADPGTPEGIGLPGGPRDVTIVGAGPGGLTAGIAGGAEGLDTLIVESNVVPGGQAKFSSRIENFPGFPIGVAGEKLTQNMFEQAKRVGAEAKLGTRITDMKYDPATGLKRLTLSDGSTIDSRAVILAGGVEFRSADFPGAQGPGVIVGDGKELTRQAAGGNAVVVGGSNGAAQAALGAAREADHVYLISRSPIAKGMSAYQIGALHNQPKVTVLEGDQIARMKRDASGNPQSVETLKGQSIPADAVGVFLGSTPDTRWLGDTHVQRDKQGKVYTDENMETAVPGVYAIGDMRSGAIGRIGLAAGEGQLALRQSYQYLEGQRKRYQETGLDLVRQTTDSRVTDAARHISRLFDLDRQHPYLGQCIEPVDHGGSSSLPGFDYNPDQPRDERGRWTSGGAGGAAKSGGMKGHVANVRRLMSDDRGGTEIGAVALHAMSEAIGHHARHLGEHVALEPVAHVVSHALEAALIGIGGAVLGHGVVGVVAAGAATYAVHEVAKKLGINSHSAAQGLRAAGHWLKDHYHQVMQGESFPHLAGRAARGLVGSFDQEPDDSVYESLSHFVDAMDDYEPDDDDLMDYNPYHEPAGSSIGGQFTSGQGGGGGEEGKAAPRGGYQFLSPQTGHLDFKGAKAALASPAHERASRAWEDIDRQLGIHGDAHSVLGAWSDGAGNSFMTQTQDADWEHLKLSAAMKGALTNQKAVLAFQEKEGGDAHLFSFDANGSLDSIHQNLLDNGISNHTLEPHAGGARVHVVDLDRSQLDAVDKVAAGYGSDIEGHEGRAEFIGTSKSDGSDAEQRADARGVYEKAIAESPVQDAQAVWQGVRDRWSEAVTEGSHPGHGYSSEAYQDDKGTIHTSDVDDAVRALYEGRKVELNQPREVSTLLGKLATVSERMIKMGAEAKNFDLCNVSVKDTNLFCAGGKGIPRIQMPQIPEEKNDAFMAYLKSQGHNVEDTTEKASFLRATQSELVGTKVAGIARSMMKETRPMQAIFVSKENYIVDGHHRWAASVGVDAVNNKFGDIDMPVRRVDMPILDLLAEADKFTGGKGHVGTDISQQKR